MARLGFFDRLKGAAVVGRQAENELFKIVAGELRAHIRDEGLWLQAISEADGNEAATEAKYIKLRIQQLKDEAELEHLQRKAEMNFRMEVDAAELKRRSFEDLEAVQKAILLLKEAGYSANKSNGRWKVREPKGALVKLDGDQAFLEYANSREI